MKIERIYLSSERWRQLCKASGRKRWRIARAIVSEHRKYDKIRTMLEERAEAQEKGTG